MQSQGPGPGVQVNGKSLSGKFGVQQFFVPFNKSPSFSTTLFWTNKSGQLCKNKNPGRAFWSPGRPLGCQSPWELRWWHCEFPREPVQSGWGFKMFQVKSSMVGQDCGFLHGQQLYCSEKNMKKNSDQAVRKQWNHIFRPGFYCFLTVIFLNRRIHRLFGPPKLLRPGVTKSGARIPPAAQGWHPEAEADGTVFFSSKEHLPWQRKNTHFIADQLFCFQKWFMVEYAIQVIQEPHKHLMQAGQEHIDASGFDFPSFVLKTKIRGFQPK